jgi:hypothetical protein
VSKPLGGYLINAASAAKSNVSLTRVCQARALDLFGIGEG